MGLKSIGFIPVFSLLSRRLFYWALQWLLWSSPIRVEYSCHSVVESQSIPLSSVRQLICIGIAIANKHFILYSRLQDGFLVHSVHMLTFELDTSAGVAVT